MNSPLSLSISHDQTGHARLVYHLATHTSIRLLGSGEELGVRKSGFGVISGIFTAPRPMRLKTAFHDERFFGISFSRRWRNKITVTIYAPEQLTFENHVRTSRVHTIKVRHIHRRPRRFTDGLTNRLWDLSYLFGRTLVPASFGSVSTASDPEDWDDVDFDL